MQPRPYTEGFMIPLLQLRGDDESPHDPTVCSICLDNDQYTYKSWVQMNGCLHKFHRHCIDLWLEQRPVCPLCLHEVRPPPPPPPFRPHALRDCVCMFFFLLFLITGVVAFFMMYMIPYIQRMYPS